MAIMYSNYGQKILVDNKNYDYYKQWTWYISEWGYPYKIKRINMRYVSTYLHIDIAIKMNLDVSQIIDHKDKNRLNNYEDNLRESDKSLNAANSKRNSRNTSGYRGVCLHKPGGKWLAQCKGYIGLFSTAEAAAEAYDRVAIVVYGDHADLNFPENRMWYIQQRQMIRQSLGID